MKLADLVALTRLSRLLAANDWQRQHGGTFGPQTLEGQAVDRNIWLWAGEPLKNA